MSLGRNRNVFLQNKINKSAEGTTVGKLARKCESHLQTGSKDSIAYSSSFWLQACELLKEFARLY